MKKLSYLFLAASVALITTSCVNELQFGIPGTEVIFAAGTYYDNGPETKTSYSGELIGTTTKYERIDWVNGDRIRIYSPEATHRYETSRHWSDYNIDASSIEINENDRKESLAKIVNDPNQHGLVWGDEGSYSFYAFYPSPTKTGVYTGLAMTNNTVTAPLPSTQNTAAAREIRDDRYESHKRIVYDPDMNLAYMYAARSGVNSGATVDLPFKPLMTAFEIILGNDSTNPLVVKDIFLFTDNSGSNLTGTFSATINANNTATVGSTVTSASHELHAGLPEFANGGTLTINKGKPITFTLFALPINIEHLGLKLKLADDSYMSIAFRFNDTLGGGWYPFLACRKYRITNVNTPEEETFTYTIEVFDPETGEVIDVTDNPITLYGHNTVAGDFSVRSYRKSNLRPSVYEPVLWKIQYTTNNGASWTDLPAAGVPRPDNAQFQITSSPSGTGVDNSTYAAGEARVANIIGDNPNDQQSGDFGPQIARAHLQNADPRGVNSAGVGSIETAFDLSRHAVYGNIDATTSQNTANSYVISAPGWYKFPLVYGNAILRGLDNKSAYWPAAATTTPVNHPADPVYGAISYLSDINAAYNQDNFVQHYYLPQFYNGLNNPITSPYILSDVGLSASQVEPVILWQDQEYTTDTAIIPYPSSPTAAPDNIGITGSGANAYIWFKIEAKDIRPGNIVIALRTSSGNKTILWSWHIWVTDRDLTPNDNVRGINLMPTNLGFIQGSDGAVEKYTDRGLTYRAVSYTVEEGVVVEQAHHDFLVNQVGDVSTYLPSIGSNPYYQWGRKDPIIPSMPGGGSRPIIRNPEYPDLPVSGGASVALEILPASNTANYAASINKPYKPMFNNATTGSVGGPVYPYYKGWRLTREDRGPFLQGQRDQCIAAGFPGVSNWYKVDNYEAAPGVFLTVWFLNSSVPYNFGPYNQTQINILLSIDQTAHFKPTDFEAMPYSAAERSSSAVAYNLWNSFIYADNVNTTNNKIKTIYDPCPPGFTVPVRKLFVGNTWPLTWQPRIPNPETPVHRDLQNPMSVAPAVTVDRSTSTKGVYYDGAFFPYTGGRILQATSLDPMEQGTGAYYWTDNPFNIQAYENQANPTDPTKLSDHWFYQFGLILSTNRGGGSGIYSGSEKAWSFTKGSGGAIRPMVDPAY